MYNANNAEEVKGQGLPSDSVLTGVIIGLKDGIVQDFIPESSIKTWSGSVDSPAIDLTIEVMVDNKSIKLSQLFTYISEDGKTKYTPKSNLGKYKTKYSKLPEVGDQVKIATNGDGFGKVKLD